MKNAPRRARPRSSFWTPLFAVAMKEVIQTARDPRMMALLVIVPTVQLIIFGNAVNLDVDRVPAILVDSDRTERSRDYAQTLFADGTLIEQGTAASAEEAGAELVLGHATVAVIIPEGFDRALTRGRSDEPAEVEATRIAVPSRQARWSDTPSSPPQTSSHSVEHARASWRHVFPAA